MLNKVSEAESKAKQDQLNGERKPPKIEGSRLAEDREKDYLIIENQITLTEKQGRLHCNSIYL